MKPAFLLRALIAGFLAILAAPVPAARRDLDKLSFGTNYGSWKAEHGGFSGAGRRHPTKLTGSTSPSSPAGPTPATACCMTASKLDFSITANTLSRLTRSPAACRWWRSPPCSERSGGAADPSGSEGRKIEDLKPLTLLVSKEGMTTYFQ